MAVVDTELKTEVKPEVQETTVGKVVHIEDCVSLRAILRLDDPTVAKKTSTGGRVIDLFDVLGRY